MDKIEETFYEIAAGEIASRTPRPGVMAKALVETKGDQKQAILRYIELRVAQLQEEAQTKQQPNPTGDTELQRRDMYCQCELVEWGLFRDYEWQAEIKDDVLTLHCTKTDDELKIPCDTEEYELDFGWFSKSRVVIRSGERELKLHGESEDIAAIRAWWEAGESS
ncbi:MAG: hypothetical protein FJ145_02735 [Deltaproteobacteria bacterium]|nr:hypothetical protein [Deltaproteobacteria bacterium]